MSSIQTLFHAVDHLPTAANALLASGKVSIVEPDSAEIPASLRQEIAARRRRFASKGLAVCHLRDDGHVLIVLVDAANDPSALRHEMIHAGQVWCSADAMRTAFLAAAADGKRIVEEVVRATGHFPDENGVHRDIHWTRSACRVTMQNPNASNLGSAFDLSLMLHPRKETQDFAVTAGLKDRQGAVAALHAHFMIEAGFDAWKSDLAREIVAYRFQAEDHPVIDWLFASAIDQLQQLENTDDESPETPCP